MKGVGLMDKAMIDFCRTMRNVVFAAASGAVVLCRVAPAYR